MVLEIMDTQVWGFLVLYVVEDTIPPMDYDCHLMHCGRYVMAGEITKIHDEVNLCYLLIKIAPSLFWWDFWSKRNVFDSLTFYISYNVSKLGNDPIKLTLVSRMIFFLYDPVYKHLVCLSSNKKKIINSWNLLIFQSLQNFKTLKFFH